MDRFDVRRGAPLLVALSLALFTACGDGEDPPTGPENGGGGGGPTATTSVTVQDNSFDPSAISVSPGATVTWTWAASASNQHNVTFSGGAMTNSPNQASGSHSATAPSTPGTYNYTCTFHAGMDGSVTVQ